MARHARRVDALDGHGATLPLAVRRPRHGVGRATAAFGYESSQVPSIKEKLEAKPIIGPLVRIQDRFGEVQGDPLANGIALQSSCR